MSLRDDLIAEDVWETNQESVGIVMENYAVEIRQGIRKRLFIRIHSNEHVDISIDPNCICGVSHVNVRPKGELE